MAFGTVSIILIILAAGLILAGIYLMIAKDWFLQFLRGFAAFGLIALAVLIIMAGLNLASYAQLQKGSELATITFTKVNEQMFDVSVVDVLTGNENKYTLEGDLWQLESRQIYVAGSSTPFYMPERISGRYFSIEQQRLSTPNTYTLPDKSIGINLWAMFAQRNIGIVNGAIAKTQYIAMGDGATYSVRAGGDNDLAVKAVNDAAVSAMEEWH